MGYLTAQACFVGGPSSCALAPLLPYPILLQVDGTLTVPVLDFGKMRRVVGVPDGQDVLDFLAGLEPAQRAEREAALHAVEQEGMAAMQVMPGVKELAKHLDDRTVPR